MPSEFKGLRDREAVLQIENEILRYKVALSVPYQTAPAFVSRSDSPVTKGSKRPQETPKKKKPSGAKGKSKSVGQENATDALTPGMEE